MVSSVGVVLAQAALLTCCVVGLTPNVFPSTFLPFALEGDGAHGL